jgi:hypothetical protein
MIFKLNFSTISFNLYLIIDFKILIGFHFIFSPPGTLLGGFFVSGRPPPLDHPKITFFKTLFPELKIKTQIYICTHPMIHNVTYVNIPYNRRVSGSEGCMAIG